MMNINDEEISDSRMTISDVAEALGVSKTTVSRAISGKGRIGADTREKVLEFISEHNFTPNAIAKSLAKSKTYNIGWVTPGDYSMGDLPFFQNCLIGIGEVASPLQYDILMSIVNGRDISQLERAVTNHKIDGAILSRTLENDDATEYLKKLNIPFVTIGLSNIKGVIQVDNDHKGACHELTSLLILKGITNMGVIGGNKGHIVTRSRLNGYLDALTEAGIKPNQDNIYLDVENQTRTDQVVEELMRKKVDCIVCMDDSLCLYAINKLKRDNVKVPQDVKLASFYNSIVLESNTPPVTSLDFDAVELGRTACTTLINYINGQDVSHKTLLSYDIIIKESTK